MITDKYYYTPPVSKLLEIGRVVGDAPSEWPDYPKEYSFSHADVPELIRLGTDKELRFDESENDENFYWGPIHAWRTLGQLKAVEAAEPLLEVFAWDDDWPDQEIPDSFSLMGAVTIPIVAKYLWNTNNDMYARASSIICLEKMVEYHPETKDECAAVLIKQLENYTQTDSTLNTFVITGLAEIKAKEALPLIETVFAEDAADTTVTDWDYTQWKFGLISDEENQRRMAENNKKRAALYTHDFGLPPLSSPSISNLSLPPKSRHKVAAKAKTKRKMAKVSRRQNRKK